MASFKNSPGHYKLEQNSFKQRSNYLTYKYSQIPLNSKLPGLGINPGNMREDIIIIYFLIMPQILKVICMELNKLI